MTERSGVASGSLEQPVRWVITEYMRPTGVSKDPALGADVGVNHAPVAPVVNQLPWRNRRGVVLLGGVDRPARFGLMRVGADEVFGVRRDVDDVEHPQVLRLVKP